MLIEPKNVHAGNTITMKLIGGDEVVARLVEDNGHQLIVKKPMVVAMAQQGFGLMPYVLTINSDSNMEISRDHVICFGNTLKEVNDAYIKQTTGLVM